MPTRTAAAPQVEMRRPRSQLLPNRFIPSSYAVPGTGVPGTIPAADALNLLVHGSFISQPAGGNSQADVTWAPIAYFAVGLEFVK